MTEQNAIEILIAGACIAGFIGFVIGCYRFSDDGSIEAKKSRKALQRGATNYARIKAVLATSGGTIKKG